MLFNCDFWRRSETVADLQPDNMKFGMPKRDVFVPGTDKLITRKYYEIYCEVFEYLQKYKADDTDAYLALMKASFFHNLNE